MALARVFRSGAVVLGQTPVRTRSFMTSMAATRSFLRAAGQEQASPGQVLARVNDLLHPDMPPRMFVTCLYGILDPRTGLSPRYWRSVAVRHPSATIADALSTALTLASPEDARRIASRVPEAQVWSADPDEDVGA